MSSPEPPPGSTIAHRRPAEVGGVAGSVALIGRAAGIDDADTIVAIGAVVGVIPAAITWAVELIRSFRRPR